MVATISNALNNLDPSKGRVCDLFSGSGTVSLALSPERPVTAVDIQEYSRVLCSAILNPQSLELNDIKSSLSTPQYLDYKRKLEWAAEPLIAYERESIQLAKEGQFSNLFDLIDFGSLYICNSNASSKPIIQTLKAVNKRLTQEGLTERNAPLILKYFGGVYFSYQQAMELDILLHLYPTLDEPLRDTFMSLILSTASDLVNTVGKQFAQPLKPYNKNMEPKKHLLNQIYRDRERECGDIFYGWVNKYNSLSRPCFSNLAVKADYLEFLKQCKKGDFSIIYADPPYTRDHYSRFYHVLETICLRDYPEISGSNNPLTQSRGLYRKDRHQSPFSIKSEAPKAFEAMFNEVHRLEIPLVLSYSPLANAEGRPRVMTIEEICELARKKFRSVEVMSAGKLAHNKLNHTHLNADVSYNAEVLILCQP